MKIQKRYGFRGKVLLAVTFGATLLTQSSGLMADHSRNPLLGSLVSSKTASEHRMIIRYKTTSTPSAIKPLQSATQLGVSIKPPSIISHIEVKKFSSAKQMAAASKVLASDPNVEYVEPDIKIRLLDSRQPGESSSVKLSKNLSAKLNPFQMALFNRKRQEMSVVMPARPPLLVTDNPAQTGDLPNDTFFSQQWSLHNIGQLDIFGLTHLADADINAPEAWKHTVGSDSVVVAVIDTGIDYTHEDLTDNAWRNPNEIPNNSVDDDGNGYIDDYYGIDPSEQDTDPLDLSGHGTHVSGIIAANSNNNIGIAGVNWHTKVLACKIFGDNPHLEAWLSDVIECMDYLYDLKMNHGINIVATNNSWGWNEVNVYSTALEEAIKRHQEADILFIASAGNSYSNVNFGPEYPGNYTQANIITVASSDDYDNLNYFSNFGNRSIDVSAPGYFILSTIEGYTPLDNPYQDIFYDNMESNVDFWSPEEFWRIEDLWFAFSGNKVWYHDGLVLPWEPQPPPGANFNTKLTSSVLDLSPTKGKRTWLSFYAAGWDRIHIEVSGDGGQNWSSIGRIEFVGKRFLEWDYLSFPIPENVRTNTFMFRFRADDLFGMPGFGGVSDMYIDNISIGTSNLVDQLTVFYDDLEQDNSDWQAEGLWEVSSSDAVSGKNAYELVAGSKPNTSFNANLVSPSVDLSAYQGQSASLVFFVKLALMYDANERLYVEGSADNGAKWSIIGSITGVKEGWQQYSYHIAEALKSKTFRLRFRTDSGLVDEILPYPHGSYIKIDDIGIGLNLPVTQSNHYAYLSGTSMSAPHVTGLAALLKAQNPKRNWKDIRNLILNGGNILPGFENTVTGRRIRAADTQGLGSLTCDNQTTSKRLWPKDERFFVKQNGQVNLAFMSIDCSDPGEDVKVIIEETQQVIQLKDEGLNFDEAKEDGIFSAEVVRDWVTPVTLSFPDGDQLPVFPALAYQQPVETPYLWREISDIGTKANVYHDDLDIVSVGFPLKLFGVDALYETVAVSPNGFIQPVTQEQAQNISNNGYGGFYYKYENVPLPLRDEEFPVIAAFWDHMDTTTDFPDTGVYTAVLGDAPNREFVVQWQNIRPVYSDYNEAMTFQMVLKEGSNDIIFNYKDVDGGVYSEANFGESATIGLQLTMDIFTHFSTNQVILKNNYSLLWQVE